MKKAFSFPFEDDEWLKKILIGGALQLTTVLIFPGILLTGYLLRTMKRGLKGEQDLPEFDNWKDMFFTGLAGDVIGTVYVLVPILFIVLGQTLGDLTSVLFLPIGYCGVFAVAYILPAAYGNFVRQQRFGAGFEFKEIADSALNDRYFKNWLIAFGVLVAGGLLTTPLQMILVGFVLQFYLMVVIFYFFGRLLTEIGSWN